MECAKGLELDPDLNFQFEEIFHCPRGYAVLYRRNNGNRVIDVVELDESQLLKNFIGVLRQSQDERRTL
jgi:hypothetical protein